jgi:hypothetical protein
MPDFNYSDPLLKEYIEVITNDFSKDKTSLSLNTLERFTGQSLPPSARRHNRWWTIEDQRMSITLFSMGYKVRTPKDIFPNTNKDRTKEETIINVDIIKRGSHYDTPKQKSNRPSAWINGCTVKGRPDVLEKPSSGKNFGVRWNINYNPGVDLCKFFSIHSCGTIEAAEHEALKFKKYLFDYLDKHECLLPRDEQLADYNNYINPIIHEQEVVTHEQEAQYAPGQVYDIIINGIDALNKEEKVSLITHIARTL